MLERASSISANCCIVTSEEDCRNQNGGIHDVENESENIQGNYAILNPSGTADNGRSNTDKNGPKYYYAAEDAWCDVCSARSCVRSPQLSHKFAERLIDIPPNSSSFDAFHFIRARMGRNLSHASPKITYRK